MAEETTFWRKLRFYSLGANLIFIPAFFILLYFFIRCRQGFSCDDCLDKKYVTVIDTLQDKPDKIREVVNTVPAPKKIGKKVAKVVIAKSLPLEECQPDSIGIKPDASGDSEVEFVGYDNCDELYAYERDTTISDTTWTDSRFKRTMLRVHTYRIIVRDTVRGELVGGAISYQNLDLVTEKKVTKFEKEKIHLYVGIAGSYNGSFKDRWGLGPSIGLSLPKIGQLGYIYDGHNNAHTFNLQYQVRFFK